MDATPRGVGDERPAPQGRGAAATGTRDDSAPVAGAADAAGAATADAAGAEGSRSDERLGDNGLGDNGLGDNGLGGERGADERTVDQHDVDEHAAEARRGERMGRAERVRRAVEAEGPAGVLGSDLNGRADVSAGEYAGDGVVGGADGARTHDAAGTGAAEVPSVSGDGPVPRRERPGRVEYPWRLARFDDAEVETDDRAPEFGMGAADGAEGRDAPRDMPRDARRDGSAGHVSGGPVFERFGAGSYASDGHDSGGNGANGHGANGRAPGPGSDGYARDGLNKAYEQPVPEPGAGAGTDARAGRTTPYVGEPADSSGGFEGIGSAGAHAGPPIGAYPAHNATPGPNAVVQLAVGEHLLTIGGPDGSEVVPLPATSRPLPVRAPVAPRSTGYPPLGRQAEIEELRGLLARGTSVRVGGPAGIGRSTLLKYLASGDAAGAPDGVIALSGHGRGLDDLLQQFHDACFSGEPYRPTRAAQAELLSGVAALVVVDDLDLSPDETEELLGIAPECAFLVASKPSAEGIDAAVRAESPFFEITLGGLPQEAAFALLARAAGRELDDEELGWAAALWFEVDGHPGRFAQAGALLARLGTGVVRPESDYDDEFGLPIPELPSPGEPQLFVPRLVPLLSRPAQQVLRLGAALDGVLPDPAHLPALTGAVDAHGAAAELVSAGLVVLEGGRHRLAGGVVDESVGVMRGPSSWAVAAIQHFTWWASHPTVTPAQVADEADVILACLREVERLGKLSSVRVLARAAAPAFASALRFEAWRDCLEIGAAAAAASGAVGEQAWFRHELAVHALCTGEPQRAREEATAATRLRDASDKRGLAADRRILVLSGERPGAFSTQEAGSAALGRRRAMSASMAGKRGVMTLGAAGLLVVTLAVVVALGSDAPGSGGGPTDDTTVSVSDVPVGDGSSPVGAAVPPASQAGRAPSTGTSAGESESATPTGIRSTPGTKSPSATATTRGATTAPATQPGQNPGPGPSQPPPVIPPPVTSPPPTPPKSTPPASPPTTTPPETTQAPTTQVGTGTAELAAVSVDSSAS
ncbi:hypothetical protein [Streptodolium elevatio]